MENSTKPVFLLLTLYLVYIIIKHLKQAYMCLPEATNQLDVAYLHILFEHDHCRQMTTRFPHMNKAKMEWEVAGYLQFLDVTN